VLARVHEHRGELAEAEQLAREAVAFSQRTDSLDEQCLALWDLAEVLAAAQRPDEAADALEQGARALPTEEEPRDQVLARLETLKAANPPRRMTGRGGRRSAR
jgi:thioredoxin-like negative regulator of GroEL